ncbi:hypothetical protein MFIFM68171_07263 [Madurella fahalii]|uniref:Uncharacterized protein n=1 Tax=Madurella fahalii TaxID=1157608 RepID=A0ABQ0GH23_9PEZI
MDDDIISGPPRRNIFLKTPKQLAEAILGTDSPTYFSTKRAWNTLGYCRMNKPELERFIADINVLWEHQAELKTLQGRKSRASMLDALRTLGFRNPRWSINLPRLDMNPQDQDGSWAQLPGPRFGRRVYGDAREYLARTAPLPTANERGAKDLAEQAAWKEFHRYQGFQMRTEGMNFYLRAIPVPKGADSLWHSVSYWVYQRGPGSGRSIWHHWQVKARIWTYFMQVLKNPNHMRYPEFHMLQHKSKSSDHDFGTLSIARSLYASQSQGKPAYPHHYLLYVIADYFHTQIILFTGGPDDKESDQCDAPYTYTVYGYGGEENKQMLLITNDQKTHYEPVDLDSRQLHDGPGYNSQARPAIPTGPTMDGPRPPIPTRVGDGDMGPPNGPCTWWPGREARERQPRGGWPRLQIQVFADSPCEEARYNYLLPAERRQMDGLFRSGHISWGDDPALPAFRFAPRRLGGAMAHRLRGFDGCVLTDDVWATFAAGLDIPGEEFTVVPDERLQRWEREGRAPRYMPPLAGWDIEHVPTGWQWRFGPDPMGLRLGPGEEPPASRVEGGRHMLDEAGYAVWEEDKWRIEELPDD